ncbi:MAG TPA: universal stress protein [Acidimicrobiales bacterium]|nr:universal stress protein [Acidimicrobiales bacterium]
MSDLLRPLPDPAYDTVLVPLDGTAFADGAVPIASSLAARFGATVHVVAVASAGDDADGRRARAADALGAGPGAPTVHVEVDGDVAGAVVRVAGTLGRCLVCMAGHGRGRLDGALVSSVPRDVIERSHQPVVVAGPAAVAQGQYASLLPGEPGADRLIACVDGTAASEQALPAAAAWAHALGMTMTILTVAEPSPPPLHDGDEWRRHHGPQCDADGYIGALAARWSDASPGVEGVAVYDPISPALGLRDYLTRHPAGLVVVSGHARTGADRLLFSATTAEIIHRCAAPVVVVPTDPRTSD